MSVSAAISKTEEIQKWRPPVPQMSASSNNIDDTTTAATANSPISTSSISVSPNRRRSGEFFPSSQAQSRKMSATSAAAPAGNSKFVNYYVTLAEESPTRCNSDEVDSSDSSMYDNFNCLETDICRDSTDDDSDSSFSIDGFHTMEVLEYEVASASASEDLYSNDSSSGTEEIFLAAVAAGAICPATSLSSDFADTEQEDSTDSDDSELSSADYWVCVKCKNRQNNPMFRYCEKCYQIRKTHFPPRPRLRKRRSMLKENNPSGSLRKSATAPHDYYQTHHNELNTCLQGTLSDSTRSKFPGGKMNYKKPRLSYNTMNRSQLNSAAETASDESDIEYAQTTSSTSILGKRRRVDNNTYSTNLSSSDIVHRTSSISQNSPADTKLTENLSDVRSTAPPQSHCNKPPSGDSIFSDSETDVVDPSTLNSQKDSGFSSTPSSQDMCLLASSVVGTKKRKVDDDYSSDTVCDDLNSEDIAEMSSQWQDAPESSSSALLRHTSEMAPASCREPQSISNVVRSVSDCADAYTNKVAASNDSGTNNNIAKSIEGLDSSTYGSCVTCLSEPKNGVFVHSRFLHLCCCYKCAVKIWNKNKKCPICNCAVKNVMKLFVH